MKIETPNRDVTFEERSEGETLIAINTEQGADFKLLHTTLDPQQLLEVKKFVDARVEQLGFIGYL
jgi:hypothetical protein